MLRFSYVLVLVPMWPQWHKPFQKVRHVILFRGGQMSARRCSVSFEDQDRWGVQESFVLVTNNWKTGAGKICNFTYGWEKRTNGKKATLSKKKPTLPCVTLAMMPSCTLQWQLHSELLLIHSFKKTNRLCIDVPDWTVFSGWRISFDFSELATVLHHNHNLKSSCHLGANSGILLLLENYPYQNSPQTWNHISREEWTLKKRQIKKQLPTGGSSRYL